MEPSKSESISSVEMQKLSINIPNEHSPSRVISFYRKHDVFLVVFAVALLNGFWGLNNSSLSNDEHCTWWAIHLSWRDFLVLVKNIDAALFPYYVFIRGWTSLLGDSESAIRFPSVIATAIAAGLTAKIGQRIADPVTGLFAGLFLSVIPATVFYAQTARPNAIAELTAVGVVCLFFRAADVPASRFRWFIYGVSIVVTGLSHFVSLSVLATHLPSVFLLKRRFPWLSPNRLLFRNWAITVLVSLLVLFPAFCVCAQQAGQLRKSELTYKSLMFYINGLTLNSSVSILLIAALLLCWVRRRPNRAMLTFWALLPVIFFFLTYDVLHIFRPRYFAFTLPAWALISALAFSSNVLCSKWRCVLPCLFFAAIVFVSYSTKFYAGRATDRNSNDAPDKKVTEILTDRAESGDAIIYGSNAPRQYHDRLAIAYAMRKNLILDDILVENSAEKLGDFRAREFRRIEKCVPHIPDRLWLLTRRTTDNRWGDIAPSKYRFISSQFDEKRTWHVRQFNLVFFTKKLNTSHEGLGDLGHNLEVEPPADEPSEPIEE
jgi:mannosyltransferase